MWRGDALNHTVICIIITNKFQAHWLCPKYSVLMILLFSFRVRLKQGEFNFLSFAELDQLTDVFLCSYSLRELHVNSEPRIDLICTLKQSQGLKFSVAVTDFHQFQNRYVFSVNQTTKVKHTAVFSDGLYLNPGTHVQFCICLAFQCWLQSELLSAT